MPAASAPHVRVAVHGLKARQFAVTPGAAWDSLLATVEPRLATLRDSMDPYAGVWLHSVWTDCPAMRANTPLTAEATGCPTRKPESLLERIARAASRPENRVVDPMCGSGTTLVHFGRDCTGVDTNAIAYAIVQERLKRAGLRPAGAL